MVLWKPFPAFITAILAIVAGFWLQSHANQDLADARAETKYAVAVANAALAYGDSMSAIALDKSEAAAAFAARADSIEQARHVKAPARAVIVAAAPAPCAPAIAALTADRNDALASASQWQNSYQKQLEATTALQAGLTRVGDATAPLAHEATNLANKSGGSFFSHLIPDIGVGAAAGVSPITRKPDAVIGITLSWKVH